MKDRCILVDNSMKNKKAKLIARLTPELVVLRARIDIKQEELAEKIGVSRQTYSAIECYKREMSWNTFLSLFLFYEHNPVTLVALKEMDGLYDEVSALLSHQSERQLMQYRNSREK